MGTDEHDRPRGFGDRRVLRVWRNHGRLRRGHSAQTWDRARSVVGAEQTGSCSARVAGQGCRAWFRRALVALVRCGRRLVPTTLLGMGSGSDDHRDQRGGRSNQCCEGRVAERRGGSGDRGPAALLYDEGGGTKLPPARWVDSFSIATFSLMMGSK